jgi:hypothetical protein
MRSLETSQKTVTFHMRGSARCRIASRKVAEKRYAPVRKVCDYNMWGRCEASRPGNIAVSGRVSDGHWRVSGKGWKAGRPLSSRYSEVAQDCERLQFPYNI